MSSSTPTPTGPTNPDRTPTPTNPEPTTTPTNPSPTTANTATPNLDTPESLAESRAAFEDAVSELHRVTAERHWELQALNQRTQVRTDVTARLDLLRRFQKPGQLKYTPETLAKHKAEEREKAGGVPSAVDFVKGLLEGRTLLAAQGGEMMIVGGPEMPGMEGMGMGGFGMGGMGGMGGGTFADEDGEAEEDGGEEAEGDADANVHHEQDANN